MLHSLWRVREEILVSSKCNSIANSCMTFLTDLIIYIFFFHLATVPLDQQN